MGLLVYLSYPNVYSCQLVIHVAFVLHNQVVLCYGAVTVMRRRLSPTGTVGGRMAVIIMPRSSNSRANVKARSFLAYHNREYRCFIITINAHSL